MKRSYQQKRHNNKNNSKLACCAIKRINYETGISSLFSCLTYLPARGETTNRKSILNLERVKQAI